MTFRLSLTIVLFLVLVIASQFLVKEAPLLHESANLFCSSNISAASDRSSAHRFNAAACPEYFQWIAHDLSPWKESGITRRSIIQARRAGSMRVIIVNGRLYAEFYSRCPQSRRISTLWGLLMLLDRFPGQIPDVDLVINCKDRPVVPSSLSSSPAFPRRFFFASETPPVFSYCTSSNTSDIPFPDYSFWGWPEVNIRAWEHELEDVVAGSRHVAWKERQAVAFWKGNANMGKQRKYLLTCNPANTLIVQQNWIFESQTNFTNSKLSEQCKQRYNIYAEGAAWSASLKYKLACGSTVLKLDSEYDEFFSRALLPGKHFVAVGTDQICERISDAIEWANSNENKAEEIGRNGQEFLVVELSMARVYEYMFHLLSHYAKLQQFSPTVPWGAQPICKSAIQHLFSSAAAGSSKASLDQPCTYS